MEYLSRGDDYPTRRPLSSNSVTELANLTH
jgi:hypothetical protein